MVTPRTAYLPPPAMTEAAAVHGVVLRRQLSLRRGASYVDAQLSARRWQSPTPAVLVLHNGPLSSAQQMWVTLLSAPPGTVLHGLSAAEYGGFRGFPPDGLQIVLPGSARSKRAARVRLPADWGVQVRWSTMLGDESILDAGGGVQSLPDREFGLLCGAIGLPQPQRQSVLRTPAGRYFLDTDWPEQGVRAEIHGLPHRAVPRWDEDLLRQNEITIQGSDLLVFSSYAVRHLKETVAHQLVRMFEGRGWRRTRAA